MNKQIEHLSDAQLEQYGAGPDELNDGLEAHLADCSACRSRLLQSQRARFTAPVEDSVHSERQPGCPGEDDLRDLAAGLSSPDTALSLARHAAQCSHCGPILRAYAEDFSGDVTSEDAAILSQLKSSSPEWQKKVAGHAASGFSSADLASKNKTGLAAWRWLLVPLAAALCVAIGVSVWQTQRETPEKVEKLLAQAYTEQRTMEMRWPGAEWGRVRVIRGAQESRFSKPEALLKAEEILARQAPAGSGIEWLLARAQADILEGNPEAAIANLNKILEARPESVDVMLDLAIATFQREQTSNNSKDFAKTIDLLGKIIQIDPTNRDALFNLAFTYSSARMWSHAVTTWQKYLKLDPDSRWAKEAKEKLEQAEANLRMSARLLQ